MNPIDYDNLISVVKLSNSNSISKNEIFIRTTNNIETLLRENAKEMFSKFKSVSLEGDLIQKTAEDYNIIIDKFIEYSKCFNYEHENDMDLFSID